MKRRSAIRVAVLLTTYNSSGFIVEQIKSIINQQNVDIKIFISDDFSDDNTILKINELGLNNLIIFLNNDRKFGVPGINFFSLVERVFEEQFDYYCFSDHDDIWFQDKLYNGIVHLNKNDSTGYSSGYHLFFTDKKHTPFVSKNPKQRKYDYLFSSPGPGCTFIIRADGYKFLRENLLKYPELFKNCTYHDWAIYAFFRANNLKWSIDVRSFIYYRQHESNDTGANKGFRAFKKRLLKINDGTFSHQVKKIFELSNFFSTSIEKDFGKFKLIPFAYLLMVESRRTFRERMIITSLFLLGYLKWKDFKVPSDKKKI